jgi:phosphoglycerate dehydrogenase-like enzyme
MNQLKERLIKLLISAKKPNWDSGNKTRVVITVNQYFTEEKWSEALKDCLGGEKCNWDIVFCKNRLEGYRHVPQADISFIFGFGDFLLKHISTPKFIYFPFLGLEFLEAGRIPKFLTIEQPPPYSAQSIAEYCVAMSINLTRNFHNSFKNQYRKRWRQNNIIPLSSASIKFCKIGVLGIGKVGSVIAENFRKLGCEVFGCDIIKPQGVDVLSSFFPSDKMLDFIEKVDILIIALPLNVSTRKIIDRNVLRTLGKDKYIINISRGEIIDEQALIHSLSEKRIKGVALDVFETEPLHRNSALYEYDNVIITSHIAGNMNLFVTEIQKDFINKALVYTKNV